MCALGRSFRWSADLELLQEGEASANWTAIVDRIGMAPSQFQGDNFWRIAKLATGPDRSPLSPTLKNHIEVRDGQNVITRVDAIYPIHELESLGIEIESRMPEGDNEPVGNGGRRSISFTADAEGPLKGLNSRSLLLRRYALELMNTEVRGSDRVDTRVYEVTLTTNPVGAGEYPLGAELTLRFEVSKQPARAFFAILLGIGAVISTGFAVWLGNTAWAILPTGLAALLTFLAFYVWSGRLNYPASN